jgi:hypothetical protein
VPHPIRFSSGLSVIDILLIEPPESYRMPLQSKAAITFPNPATGRRHSESERKSADFEQESTEVTE